MAIILLLFSGLGLFLYGIRVLSNNMEKAAGSRFKAILSRLTSNRITGITLGFFVTAAMQSSSAVTVMLVSMVNGNIMNLNQALGIIMGTNIGTTVTAQFIIFDIYKYIPIILVLGSLMSLTCKRKKARTIGEILAGIGMVFTGMEMMKQATAPLKGNAFIQYSLIEMSVNPLLAVGVGFCTAALIQSSTAGIAMIQALACHGMLDLDAALPLLFGQNIGTCTTALISSIGTSIAARRVAVMHLLFNTIGTLVIMLLLPLFKGLAVYISPQNVPRQIANAHTLFNIITTIMLYPFGDRLIMLTTKLVGRKK
ncbi:MAG TPA: Na/Pi cotransporter family protein [Clostridiales bacterium]|nr:Na/Pi cotransporter family protein [Clostridiales bacterium]